MTPAVALAVLCLGQPPAGVAAWKFDEIVLTNGATFTGLVLSESADRVRFQIVRRPPGKPTVTLTDTFTRGEVATVRRLPDDDRKVLVDRLADLDPTGKGEQRRMDTLSLKPADWLGRPGAARRYDGDHFALVSTAPDEVVRRAAVRLEQLYTAFARVLPPAATGAPTDILLAADRDEYWALLGPAGRAYAGNPAVFDPAANRILCGSDLRRLGAELAAARAANRKRLDDIDAYDGRARVLFKNKAELERLLAASRAERVRVRAADDANTAAFDAATARLFAVLSHEAFHAYVNGFVYRPLSAADVRAGRGTGELPRWLNEGLAQAFETAVVEAGELRADHVDPDRLVRTRELLRAKPAAARLVPLSDLLVGGKDLFRAGHADGPAAADRAYLTSWGLAHYLTFDRHLVGTPAFGKYLAAVNGGADPRGAFAALVGDDLSAFEGKWHAYLLRLRADGATPAVRK